MSALEALYRDLSALDAAIAHDDLATAADLLDTYGQRLRDTVTSAGAALPAPALRALLDAQLALTARLGARRDTAAAQLRQAHRANAASRVYAGLEQAS
ncbi:hypothetical protein MNO14_07950 [Luteimonas sp. S4-F44]|uniref:hypothetical protein n=1 Tax=Luteimonas sp. S4-F44 TaxID=2925842 RepID=UPI001F533C97|nr:hypothetical protein [Luteimonas sp. S4-F44]UNK43969.1 hypothetical protein MNO14_07950 [Luteimonas sp. S4-F44]